MLIQVIVFGSIAIYILGALVGWAVIDINLPSKLVAES